MADNIDRSSAAIAGDRAAARTALNRWRHQQHPAIIDLKVPDGNDFKVVQLSGGAMLHKLHADIDLMSRQVRLDAPGLVCSYPSV